jgi:hypothetical protein
MRLYYVLEHGLPLNMQTGCGTEPKVSSLQYAIKKLHKNKEVEACKQEDIQVFPIGTTKANFRDGTRTPLQPDDPLPKGSTSQNYIFVYVPRDEQQMTTGGQVLSNNGQQRTGRLANNNTNPRGAPIKPNPRGAPTKPNLRRGMSSLDSVALSKQRTKPNLKRRSSGLDGIALARLGEEAGKFVISTMPRDDWLNIAFLSMRLVLSRRT